MPWSPWAPHTVASFRLREVQGDAELSDEQLGGVAGGFIVGPIHHGGRMRGSVSKLRLSRGSKGRFRFGEIKIVDPSY